MHPRPVVVLWPIHLGIFFQKIGPQDSQSCELSAVNGSCIYIYIILYL